MMLYINIIQLKMENLYQIGKSVEIQIGGKST